MKRRSSYIAWAAVLMLGLTSDPSMSGRASARPSPAGEPVTLRGVTIIEASNSSMVYVRIPQDVTVDRVLRPHRRKGPSGSVSITGKGRLAGIALASMPPVESVSNDRFLAAGRLGTCRRMACDPSEVVNFQMPFRYPAEGGEDRHTLKAGDYRLYLLADGAPVRVRLELQGLEGRTRIFPAISAPVDLKTPKDRVVHLGGPSYFSAGDTFSADGRGLAVSMLSVHGPKEAINSTYGMCGGQRVAGVPENVAYGPHCNAAASGGWVGMWSEAHRFDVVFIQGFSESDFPPPDGTRQHGVWLMSHSKLERVATQIFVMSLE